MIAVFPLPRLLFGAGAINNVAEELSRLDVHRPLLVSDRGLERAGIVERVAKCLPLAIPYLDIPENPAATDVDTAFAAFVSHDCDSIIALGGGSVIDAAKFIAALATRSVASAADLLGKPERIGIGVVPLIAIPTTLGTGSECSPAAGLHPGAGLRAIGTRSSLLVPKIAICDPDLTQTLPRHLVAATAIDALSHCLEGFLAQPSNPIVDAVALDGLVGVWRNIRQALHPDSQQARTALMAAAFAGGIAIHKGLGPAHAVALAYGDQHLHHGVIVAAALPETLALLLPHAPDKAVLVAQALGADEPADLPDILRRFISELGLPASLRAAGYKGNVTDEHVAAMVGSPFNRTSPYVPTTEEYRSLAQSILG